MKKKLVLLVFFFFQAAYAVTALFDKKQKFNFDPSECLRFSDRELKKLCRKKTVHLHGVTQAQFQEFVAYASSEEAFDTVKNFAQLPIFFSIAQQLNLPGMQQVIVDAITDYFRNSLVLKEYQSDPHLLKIAPIQGELLQKVINQLSVNNPLMADIYRFVRFQLTPIELGQELSLSFVTYRYDPSGKYIAFAQDYGPVVIIDTHDGSVKHHLKVDADDMRLKTGASLLLFNPSGEQIIRATESGVLYIWDVQSGTLLRKINHDRTITALAFLKSGTQMLAVDTTSTVIIFDYKTGAVKDKKLVIKKTDKKQNSKENTFFEQEHYITHIAVDKRSTLAAVAFDDNSIEILRIPTFEYVATIDNKNDIAFMDFSGQQLEIVTKPAGITIGAQTVANPIDFTVTREVYDIRMQDKPSLYLRRSIETKITEDMIAYDPKTKRCVLMGAYFDTEIWDLDTEKKIAVLAAASLVGIPLGLNPAKNQLVSWLIGSEMHLVDLSDIEVIQRELQKLSFAQALFLQILVYERSQHRSIDLNKEPWRGIVESFAPPVRAALEQYATVKWWQKPTQKFIDAVKKIFGGTQYK